MIFKAYPPSKNLQPFVQSYLEADCRVSSEKGEHILFPNGLSGIFFNFGNIGKLIINEEYKTPHVSVFGQIDRHFTAMHWPGFYSVGVLLKPTVLSKILGADMSEFTNRAIDGKLLRSDFSWLHQQIEESKTIQEKIKLIEHFFSKALSGISNITTVADHAIQSMNLQPYLSISKLADKLGISDRYLEMHFKRFVGISPKTYSLILRFKRMEQQLSRMSMIHWQDMTFANEYHDQNHFIKDFKRFTGNTPSDYLLKNFEMGRSYLLR